MAGDHTLAGEGGAAGAIVGAGIGAFVGLGVLASSIPPILVFPFALGTIATILVNTGAGALIIGIIGYLVGLGIPDLEPPQ